jgi:hypothetical protein
MRGLRRTQENMEKRVRLYRVAIVVVSQIATEGHNLHDRAVVSRQLGTTLPLSGRVLSGNARVLYGLARTLPAATNHTPRAEPFVLAASPLHSLALKLRGRDPGSCRGTSTAAHPAVERDTNGDRLPTSGDQWPAARPCEGAGPV